MEIEPQSTANICSHCNKSIPASNYDLHVAFCSRNLERCTYCGDMISKRYADEHYSENHAPVDCSLCSQKMEREILDIHKGEICPQRIVTCEYCEFPLPAVDLSEHQEVCGNRTEYCNECNKYVRLREQVEHQIQFHSGDDGTAESSRNGDIQGREEHHGRGQQGRDISKKRFLFTIAITGIAVLLGSIFFQRRVDTQQQQ